jgi:hypothetical protein
MRGQACVGSISEFCGVEPNGVLFRGRLSVPQFGTRFTEDVATREEAQKDLDALRLKHFPASPGGDGFSAKQKADIAQALALKA